MKLKIELKDRNGPASYKGTIELPPELLAELGVKQEPKSVEAPTFRESVMYIGRLNKISEVCRQNIALLQADLSRTEAPAERTRLYQAVNMIESILSVVMPDSGMQIRSDTAPTPAKDEGLTEGTIKHFEEFLVDRRNGCVRPGWIMLLADAARSGLAAKAELARVRQLITRICSNILYNGRFGLSKELADEIRAEADRVAQEVGK